MRKTTTKRRRKKRYHTGTHKSDKCISGSLKYRSGWELEVAIFFDNNKDVAEYSYELTLIPYISNIRTGKIRTYYPDFLVTYVDGSRKLIEVKRKDKLSDKTVIKKAQAAEQWCKKNGVIYEIWTNEIIEVIKKINNPLQLPKSSKRRVVRRVKKK